MDWSSKIGAFLSDERLLANLIALHGLLLVLLCVSFVTRTLVRSGGQRVFSLLGISWLKGVTDEATDSARNFVYWITLALMAAGVVGGVFYHLGGRDIRGDAIMLWNRHITADDLITLGIVLAKLVGVAIGSWVLCGFVRQLRRRIEANFRGVTVATVLSADEALETETPDAETDRRLADTAVGPVVHVVVSRDELPEEIQSVVEDPPESESMNAPATPHDALTRWFNTLERFSVVLVVLGGVWLAAQVAHIGALETCTAFLVPIVGVILIARLLALSSSAMSRGLANLGDRHLSGPSSLRYWERAKRLFPFGQKCFEAVVYVWAGARIVRDLGLHLANLEQYSDRVIACIGIFLATRVLIELLHVLVNEAFGMFDPSRTADQKGQTLVPLLQSVIQYVLYFGSVVVMLEVMQGPTNTILAGAGLLGLAVGLGAQSLVSDVVSGFFILFEGQYLVGDIVQIGDANGRVEVVSIRHTQIRDDHGKLYIIPNGQIKQVTNYSKGWVNAVVDVKASTTTNLDALIKDMVEAGRRLKAARREVIADTVIKGLVDLSPGDMTVRAVTRVTPGSHATMQAEYRRHLKEVMDQKSASRAA